MHRIRVPYVHPIVCCTFKRALRLLPSILLIAFVLSLIFITLIQVAVIHSQRRAIYLQRRVNGVVSTASSSPLYAQPSASSYLSSYNQQQQSNNNNNNNKKTQAGQTSPTGPSSGGSTSKPGEPALRVEAILDRNAPSVENFAVLVYNNANAARIRRIFDAVKCHVSNSSSSSPPPSSSTNSATVPPAVIDESLSCGSTTNVTLCAQVPTGLRGRLKVDFSDRTNDSQWEGASALSQIQPGGWWSPSSCTSRHRVAIVIPFRDRAEHLSLLLQHLHPILQRQLLDYKVFVVEQFGNDTFNKGVLLNAGAREALQDSKDYECLVFHDVDLIPEDDRNLYSCPTLPRHMSVAVDKFNYTLPYVQLVGGVFSVSVRDFVQLNGYSNLYWGWGGEDDDMAHRIKHKKLKIVRPPASVGRYTMIRHAHRPESPNNIRMTFIRMASYRMNRDGLTTAKYTVVGRYALPFYTKVVVDIGHNHKWHFANPQKLIVSL
ncbi:beta-1,4-galactosyltransferase 2-like [Galendromus occidentalis]|uniref:Beta-1,4-N-acetylgalactosaminyltransferase n=1 Tax=Galendromus occidentalis TaxID=34638 RepID=A0AAJ7L438_9ACAR|nr:beta-1,4-galactosyltransferase 2-like [Galendromus occidentalis]